VTLDARPERTAHQPGESVRVVVDASAEAAVEVEVSHLGEVAARRTVTLRPGRQVVDLGPFAPGSYAVRLRAGSAPGSATVRELSTVATAFDVLIDSMSRPRYGFLTDFRPGRDDEGALGDSMREFHLNALQFYDWMYRHAELVPPVETFRDALGRSLSLDTVRRLVDTVHDIGARALAYAAVYGAGVDYASAHPEQVLHRRDGAPWMLADFLWIMDVSPGSEWSSHIVAEMRRAVDVVGFDGLHLDQYGHPKVAVTASGRRVDLAEAFPALIDAVRETLPASTLIFNNVNDFPTRHTVRARQDVTYIEVWSPHDDYAELVRLVDAARDLAPRRPVVLAAYLAPFATAGGAPQLAAAKLALSTVWASGSQYLLFGEVHGALVDPYYPRHAALGSSAVAALRTFADFAVSNGDLLFDPESAPTTGAMVGGVNEDVEVTGVAVSRRPEAGHVWVRTSRVLGRLVLQLVDYTNQPNARWNEPKTPTAPVAEVTVRLRVVARDVRVWFGQPSAGPELRRILVQDDADVVTITLPVFDTWAVLVVDG